MILSNVLEQIVDGMDGETHVSGLRHKNTVPSKRGSHDTRRLEKMWAPAHHDTGKAHSRNEVART